MSTVSATFPDKRSTADPESLSLLERIGSGDHDAVSECIARYGDLVWHLALKFTDTTADAEDAVQDIFLEIWQKSKVFDRSLASEQTFIAMLARRRLIDRRRRMHSAVTTVAIDGEVSESTQPPAVDAVELCEEAAKAAICMEKLSSVQRTVLTMSIHHGHSHNTIANFLKIPLGTVKSFARRGLLQLRDCMNRNHLTHAGTRSS